MSTNIPWHDILKDVKLDATIPQSAGDIKNAVADGSITLRWNNWAGKDVYNYQAQFSAAVIKQGLINRAEACFIKWGHCQIHGGYDNEYIVPFTVSKDGVTLNDHAVVYAIAPWEDPS